MALQCCLAFLQLRVCKGCCSTLVPRISASQILTDLGLTDLQTTTRLASLILGFICLLNMMVPGGSEVRLAHNDCRNLKLAWEDVRNHGRMELSVKWLPSQLETSFTASTAPLKCHGSDFDDPS